MGEIPYPDWTLVLGEMMTTSVFSGIVFYIIYIIIETTCIQKKVIFFDNN
jgi:hypothetical protein